MISFQVRTDQCEITLATSFWSRRSFLRCLLVVLVSGDKSQLPWIFLVLVIDGHADRAAYLCLRAPISTASSSPDL
ncbi:hypothetical protein E4T56_gene3121 [Termitomyces sp. T112]|nr:hypothetical protein E4T56_gene3121 [Termitomyces sp. T112]